MKFTAAEVQAMFNVKDHEDVAVGYTFDGRTVKIYFAYNKLVRAEYKYEFGEEIVAYECDSEFFEFDYFDDSIKRFYRKKTNELLVKFFNTFGPGIRLVD